MLCLDILPVKIILQLGLGYVAVNTADICTGIVFRRIAEHIHIDLGIVLVKLGAYVGIRDLHCAVITVKIIKKHTREACSVKIIFLVTDLCTVFRKCNFKEIDIACGRDIFGNISLNGIDGRFVGDIQTVFLAKLLDNDKHFQCVDNAVESVVAERNSVAAFILAEFGCPDGIEIGGLVIVVEHLLKIRFLRRKHIGEHA